MALAPGQTRPGIIPHLHAIDSACIPIRAFHVPSNPGSIRPRAIKIHTGTYLKEDAIERAKDDCGRS